MNSTSCGGWPLRGPREMLAGCVWLARLTDKVRLHHARKLPANYIRFLGHPRGVEGHFLRHFNLSNSTAFEAIGAAGDDLSVEQWFLSHPAVIPAEIATWNQLAPNLGRIGYPGAAELQYVINHVLEPEARVPGISTIFEAIEIDEIATLQKSPKI